MFADSYPMREVEDGFFFEVDGKVRFLAERRKTKKNRGSIGPPRSKKKPSPPLFLIPHHPP